MTDLNLMPHINVEEGIARAMGKVELYRMLLEKCDLTQMIESLKVAMSTNALKDVTSHAHAIKGLAANLAFPTLQSVTYQIEVLSKGGMNPTHLEKDLKAAVDGINQAIAAILGT